MIATWRRCGVTGTRMLLSGCVLAIFLGGVTPLEAAAQTQGSPAVSFPDEPAVHAQYDKLVQILQQAESFSYDSTYRWGARGEEIGHATYQLWMKKPGLARLEAYRDGRLTGTLVGDGEQFWIFWPDKRPMMSLESEAEYATSSTKVYMREARPANLYSIAHQTSKLGSMGMLIMQPSIVHGNMGSLEEYLDAVRGRGTEEVGGETCEVIELSYMKGQRSKYYWLA
jgi:outer membrane lipoprotein-sorting protein